jgi:hypothetical protein
MTCRRICRELLWLTRFGEIGQDSAPHLEHLAGGHACRDEVGFDRAMVQQLRLALAQRIGDATPSAAAWDGVLDRMRRPEPQLSRVRAWTARLVVGLRAGTAMAGASLALIVALNLEVVSIVPSGIAPEPDQPSGAASRDGVSPDAIHQWIEVAPIDAAPASDEEQASSGAPMHPAEQLPITRFGRNVDAPDASTVDVTNATDTVDGPADVRHVLAVQLVPADRVGMNGGADSGQSGDAGTEEPEPVPDPPLDGPS